MLSRRRFLGTVGASLLGVPAVAAAQPQARNVHRVGVLASDDTGGLHGFREALRSLGYTEGQNLIIEARYDKGHPERLPALAAELVKLNVHVILAASSAYVRAAKQATNTIPIVFAIHTDPVGTGDVASLARPGGNITGTTQMPGLSAKQLELLKEAVPGLTRVGVLWNPTTPSHAPAVKEAEIAARRLGVELSKLGAERGGDLEQVFATAARERVGAVFVMSSAMVALEKARVVGLATKHRLPTMFTQRPFVEAGGLLAYGVDLLELFRHAASYVDKILKGAKPALLPVEQPTKLELAINLKTAKALGLTIPQSLLLRADHVIQ